MKIITRNSSTEDVNLNKITDRIQKAIDYCGNLHKCIDPVTVSIKVINSIRDNITTSELDEITARICMNLSLDHPDWGKLGSRIIISNHQKNCRWSFSEAMEHLWNNKDSSGVHSPLISEELYNIVRTENQALNECIFPERDFELDFFGFKTLEKSYLLKTSDGIIRETPQYLFMRVALGMWGKKKESIETYNMLSKKLATHATPTLFNSGTPHQGLASCFLLGTTDSVDGIYKTISDCAKISKWAGGIGVHISNIRCKDSYIRGTGGRTDGIIPMLKVYNHTARYIDQCFTPETQIYTKNGIKEIQDIEVNDEVITKDGTFKQVIALLSKDTDEEIYEIEVKNSLYPVKVTKEHPFYVLKNQKKSNSNMIANRLDKNLISPEWVEASKLTNNDLIGFPIPQYTQDTSFYSQDDCLLYGIMLGCGHISKTINEAYIEVGTKLNSNVQDFIVNYFTNKSIHLEKYENKEQNCTKYTWKLTQQFPFIRNNLYDNNSEKRIMSCMLHLPKEKIKNIIKGLLWTNRCIAGEITLEMTSKNVIDNMRYLLLRLGVLSSGYISDKIEQTHKIRIPKVKEITDLLGIEVGRFIGYFKYNDFVYSRINNIKTEQYKGMVYDIEVNKNHNYLTNSGLVHNGGGKRKGSFAFYLEPHHGDIISFLKAMRNHGDEESLARDLFYALWVSDAFMNAVKNDDWWYLMCPDECPGLTNCYGEDFEKLYYDYVKEGNYRNKIKAREVWSEILKSQVEAGMPYIAYKDNINRKSNQKNIGVIKSSNLCIEVMEYSDDKEYAVCTLSSICLPKFLKRSTNIPKEGVFVYTIPNCDWCKLLKCFLEEQKIPYEEIYIDNKEDKEAFIINYKVTTFPQLFIEEKLIGGFDASVSLFRPTINYSSLRNIVHTLVKNLNRVIDINYYPVPETKLSNEKHRPMGIGIQGLADLFIKMWLPFTSCEAKKVNRDIFEAIYFFALEMSCIIAKEKGPYETFEGSPLSEGKFQQDLWNIPRTNNWNWEGLEENIRQYGVRNSLLIALMPTASTSQIMGNSEMFEPYTSNMYVRRTLSGEFIVINRFLMNILCKLGIWNKEMKQRIMYHRGSVQNIKQIPSFVKQLFKTSWEISKKDIIEMAADRGCYVDQSQSMNIYADKCTPEILTKIHLLSWKKGLKTGGYYVRSRPAVNADNFTISPELEEKFKREILYNKTEECLSCGS